MATNEPEQPSLFLLPHEQRAAERAEELARWTASFQRAEWTAPGTTATGNPAGTTYLGWICPACGEVEPTAFTLSINHGLDPTVLPHPYQCARLTNCTKQWRRTMKEKKR